MTIEQINFHIQRLETVLEECKGQLNVYNKGKNAIIRKAAGRKLDYAVLIAKQHLDQYPEIIDFMAEVASCDPVYLEYPEFHHIETDTIMFLEALRAKLQKLNQD